MDPDSLDEALSALGQYGDDAKVLAGGQSLVPLLNMRLAQPRVVIDLNRIPELSYLRTERRDGVDGIGVGAMTRQRAVERSPHVQIELPLLSEGIGWVGHPQIRNRGTVGGSIAHADPAAELPLLFLSCEGVATARSSRGARPIPAVDFFVFTFTPALESDEILTDLWFPLPAGRYGHAFLEVARRHGDFALVAVAVMLSLDEQGAIDDVRIALGGVAPVPMRATRAESFLRGSPAGQGQLREAGALVASEVQPSGDIHAGAEYRADVAATLTVRALARALERVHSADA